MLHYVGTIYTYTDTYLNVCVYTGGANLYKGTYILQSTVHNTHEAKQIKSSKTETVSHNFVQIIQRKEHNLVLIRIISTVDSA